MQFSLPFWLCCYKHCSPASLEAQFVHGYVYDASDSTGIASAYVEGKYASGAGYFSAYTDTTGYYNVDTILPSGWWTVTASHAQYFPQKKEAQLPKERYLNFYLVPRD